MQVYSTSSGCKERYFLRDVPQIGFSVTPTADGLDSVQAAIDRDMAASVISDTRSSCSKVCNPVILTQKWAIDSAPEYFRVVLFLFSDGQKNTSAVHFNEWLDITRYLGLKDRPKPIQYKLTSAVYHRGGTKSSGHYTAGVTSGRGKPPGLRPQPRVDQPDFLQWFCNDQYIDEWTEPEAVANKMTINPVNRSTKKNVGGDFNAYVLWYVRDTPAAAKTAVAIPVDNTTIAERLLVRKRAAREEGAEGAKEGTTTSKKARRE